MEIYSPAQLKVHLEQAGDTMLIDVRAPSEYEFCRIPGSRNIPMEEIPVRLDELDKDREMVFVCHHGMRSLQAAQYLHGIGYKKIANLEGGLDAWAREVDPNMPQY